MWTSGNATSEEWDTFRCYAFLSIASVKLGHRLIPTDITYRIRTFNWTYLKHYYSINWLWSPFSWTETAAKTWVNFKTMRKKVFPKRKNAQLILHAFRCATSERISFTYIIIASCLEASRSWCIMTKCPVTWKLLYALLQYTPYVRASFCAY